MPAESGDRQPGERGSRWRGGRRRLSCQGQTLWPGGQLPGSPCHGSHHYQKWVWLVKQESGEERVKQALTTRKPWTMKMLQKDRPSFALQPSSLCLPRLGGREGAQQSLSLFCFKGGVRRLVLFEKGRRITSNPRRGGMQQDGGTGGTITQSCSFPPQKDTRACRGYEDDDPGLSRPGLWQSSTSHQRTRNKPRWDHPRSWEWQ